MQFGQAFSYVFKDPDWIKKLLLAGLVSLIPVVGQFFLAGWGLEVTRRLIDGEDPVLLPDLNFGATLGKGFQAAVIGFIYSIPVIIFALPMSLIGPIGAAMDMDMDTLGMITMVVSVCCGGLILIYSIFMALMVPAALGNFVAKGGIGSGLQFKEVFGLVKARPVSYLLVLVGGIVSNFIGLLGSIACGIGVLITMPYSIALCMVTLSARPITMPALQRSASKVRCL